jgi:hypothetical protein
MPMAESRVKRENYISLQGWMLTDLGLKGNELIIYACIYGFSQAEDQMFTGSLQYLADWTNSTRQGVSKCLKSLVEKGYVIKADKVINGVKFCEYRATEFNGVLNKVVYPMQQSLTGGVQQSLTNNLGINTTDNILDFKKESKKEQKKKTESFDSIIDGYTDNQELKEALIEFIKMRQRIRKPMTNYALSLMLKKLDKLGSTTKNKTNVLNQSIVNGWQDVYPLKQNGQRNGQRQIDQWDDRYYKPAQSTETDDSDDFLKMCFPEEM